MYYKAKIWIGRSEEKRNFLDKIFFFDQKK